MTSHLPPHEGQNGAKPLAPSLAQRALDRVRGVAAGNGLNPHEITLAAQEEATYELAGELTLNARYELELAKPDEIARLEAKPIASQKDLQDAANNRAWPASWWQAALDELKQNNVGSGTGWGADGLTITLPHFTQLYRLQELCRRCGGQKWVNCDTCEGTGLEWCWHCNRTGREPANPQQPCTVCLGELKAECRTCNGRRLVSCPACNGRGSGITTYALRFVANTRFGIKAGPELPTPLRRAIDRAGTAKLANGHATIRQEPATEDLNPLAPKIMFTAIIPFASVRFQIGGEKYSAEVLGHRTAILEMKPFLDAPVSAALNNATLHQLRLFKEAQVVAARRGQATDFMRNYPVGLSRDLAEKVFVIARRALNDLLQKPRRLGTLAAVAASALLSLFYFLGPLRDWTFQLPFAAPKFFDLVFPVLLAGIYLFWLQWWTGQKLGALFGRSANLPPLFNRVTLLGAALIIVLHLAIMVLQPEPPAWYFRDKLLLEVWLTQLGR